MTRKGLLVSIYKHKGQSCDNGFFSSRFDKAILTDPNNLSKGSIPELFQVTYDAPELVLRERMGDLIAVPAIHGVGAGPMFGGSFIFSHDSRFPKHVPIRIHDRWEATL